MKVLHVSYYDSSTGSGIAACRLHEALLKHSVESEMLVMHKESPLASVKLAPCCARMGSFLNQRIAARILSLQKSSNPFSHSLNCFSNSLLKSICRSDADVVHLHWIGGEMLSVEQVAKIHKPLVWTLHDSWAFCGTEHCLNVLRDNDARYKTGYTKENRPAGEKGPDLARMVWERKQKYWKDLNVHFVTPGSWMNERRRESALLGNFAGSVIHNCLDTDLFTPERKKALRSALGIPPHSFVILAGAQNLKDPLKGMRYLKEALCVLPESLQKQCVLLTFGSGGGSTAFWEGCTLPVIHKGVIRSGRELAELYPCADVFVCPSVVDNFPNTVLEATACGVPCVAFRTGGLPEMIRHRESGYLCPLEESAALAEGIGYCLLNQEHLSANARKFALERYAPGIAAEQYIHVYETLLAKSGK